MPMEKEFEDACAKIGEHCGEYLVIGRFSNGLIWKESCQSFAMGAAKRYLTVMDEKERHNVRIECANESTQEDE